jgi:endoglucanase
MKKGIALFVTEWGTCDSSGDGGFNPAATDVWLKFCKDNMLSMCNWAVNDKAQTVSIIKPGSNPKGGWTAVDYTESGTYVREKMRNWKITGK